MNDRFDPLVDALALSIVIEIPIPCFLNAQFQPCVVFSYL